MSMTVAEAVVKVLQAERVPFVAGVPGSGVMDYLDVLYGVESPRFILVRHEQVAAHMALGYAEFSGRPAAVLVSRSPGASNTVIGVQAAYAEGSPLVLISSHVNSEARGLGAFQEIELEALFRPITKMSVEVRDAMRVPSVLQEAFRVAVSGKPGPVHVSIPLNFPSKSYARELSAPSWQVVGCLAPTEAQVDELARRLADARRPAIIAGGGVTKSGAAESVLRLAERLGAAYTNSWEKKAMAERHPLATGNIGRGGTDASARVLHEADVILAVGFRFSEFATEDYRMQFGEGQTLMQIDVDPANVGRVHPVQVGVAADARTTLEAVLSRLQGWPTQVEPTWGARIAKHKEDWEEKISMVEWDHEPIISPRLVRDLRTALADDAVVACDSGNFNYWLERYLPATVPGAYLYPAAVGPMGCGMPAAMGVKVAYPDRQVVAVAGDGGYAMTMQDLETCVREKINITVVVVNNFGFGNIKIRQQTKFGNRLIGSEFGNPDFAAVAELMGAYGETVTRPADIAGALKRALEAGRPALLDVHVDPEEICTATIDSWW